MGLGANVTSKNKTSGIGGGSNKQKDGRGLDPQQAIVSNKNGAVSSSRRKVSRALKDKKSSTSINHESQGKSTNTVVLKRDVYISYQNIAYRGVLPKQSLVKWVNCRCEHYLPAGIPVNADGAKWSRHRAARPLNPLAKPYRCPGMLALNKETFEMKITVAHECTSTLSLVNQTEPTNEATDNDGHGHGDGDVTDRQMEVGAPPSGESSSSDQSANRVIAKTTTSCESISGMDGLDDNDNSEASSGTDDYKQLVCIQIGAFVEDFRKCMRENKRLKTENMDLRSRLNGQRNVHQVDEYTPYSFAQKYA